MKKVLSSNKGFSLIELIVVIAILGILVGVAAPNLIGYVEKSRIATDVANLQTIEKAAHTYVAENYSDVVPVSGEKKITEDVANANFNGTLPTLKSNNATDIEIKVDSSAKITVTPTQADLQK